VYEYYRLFPLGILFEQEVQGNQLTYELLHIKVLC